MTEERETGLIIAAREAHLKIVKLLVTAEADVNLQGGHEDTALQLAVEENHVETVKLLLKVEAEVNIQKYNSKVTPLRSAVSEGHS